MNTRRTNERTNERTNAYVYFSLFFWDWLQSCFNRNYAFFFSPMLNEAALPDWMLPETGARPKVKATEEKKEVAANDDKDDDDDDERKRRDRRHQ